MIIREQELKQAAELIVKAERELGRLLSAGRQRDLLKDNADWPQVAALRMEVSMRCDAIVDSLNMSWGVGAFQLAEARSK